MSSAVSTADTDAGEGSVLLVFMICVTVTANTQ
jgi:hypothetical protein